MDWKKKQQKKLRCLYQFHNNIPIIKRFSLKSSPTEGLHIVYKREEGRLTDEASILACPHTRWGLKTEEQPQGTERGPRCWSTDVCSPNHTCGVGLEDERIRWIPWPQFGLIGWWKGVTDATEVLCVGKKKNHRTKSNKN